MSNETALALVKDEPGAGVLMRRATDVAGTCKEIVLRTAQSIQGKKYVRVEGWQSIANTFGCVASARDVETVPGGIRAIGEVRRMSDGAVLSTGEGFVGDDEPTWSKRPLFARRAMAQTRAISRACRGAFAFVVVLMDAGLSTTPAEEMEAALDHEKPPKPPGAGTAALKAKVQEIAKPSGQTVESKPRRMEIQDEPPPLGDSDAPGAAQAKAGANRRAQAAEASTVVLPFGAEKGVPLTEAKTGSLSWALDTLSENIKDPARARWKEDNQRLAEAIERELATR